MVRVDADRKSSGPMFESLESRRLMSAVIASVTFAGTTAAPLITIKGSGFGSLPKKAVSTAYPLGTGNDFSKGTFYFVDDSANPLTWRAGVEGNYIGLSVSKYSNKLITYTFGSGLAEEIGNYSFNAGDDFEVGVNGSTASGSVLLDGSNRIPVAANVSATVSKSTLPTTVAAGAKVKGTVSYVLANSGNLAATGPLSINVYAVPTGGDYSTFVGATVLKSVKHVTLHAGVSQHGSLQVPGVTLSADTYYVFVVVKLADGSVAQSFYLTSLTVN